MLIIEGPDCSGKTSLAADIEADFPYLAYRRPPSLSSTKGANSDVYKWWTSELGRSAWERMHGVYDRCFVISEPVYTTVTGRTPNCSPEAMASIVNQLIAQRPTIIFCLPDWEKINAAMSYPCNVAHDRLEGLTPPLHQLTHWAYFNQLVLWAGILNTRASKLVYQYDWDNREEIMSVVAKYVEIHSGF